VVSSVGVHKVHTIGHCRNLATSEVAQ
jgi:hypothetical protein